jgi:hypothetical protein
MRSFIRKDLAMRHVGDSFGYGHGNGAIGSDLAGADDAVVETSFITFSRGAVLIMGMPAPLIALKSSHRPGVKRDFASRQKGAKMAKWRAAKMAFVLTLLAVLLSYSFDFECLLETSHCGQQITVQAESDNTCSQPSLLTSPAALLPATSVVAPPASIAVNGDAPGWLLVERSWIKYRVVPLGLRAPPRAS